MSSLFTLNDMMARVLMPHLPGSIRDMEEAYRAKSRCIHEEGDCVGKNMDAAVRTYLGKKDMMFDRVPLLVSPFEKWSLVFVYGTSEKYEGYRLLERGVCDYEHKRLLLFSLEDSQCSFFQQIVHESDGLVTRFFVSLVIPMGKIAKYSGILTCTACVATQTQSILGRILNGLLWSIHARGFSKIDTLMKNLLEDLERVNLAHRMDELLSYVTSGEHDGFIALCDILELKRHEREFIGQQWEEALQQTKRLVLPFVAKQQSKAFLVRGGRSLGWNSGKINVEVTARLPDVTDYMDELQCVVDGSILTDLVKGLRVAGAPLRQDGSLWKELADKNALEVLRNQMETFSLH